ncbi:MAG: porin [Betaproteobacteria bacterium]|nr:porin [Betaproteobacteria bacterium]
MNTTKLLTVICTVCASAIGNAWAAGPTLYGNIDVGVTHATGLPHGSSTQLTAGNDFPDQVGLRGSESLGSGTSVIYDIATGFCGAGEFNNGVSSSLPAAGFCTGGGFMQRTSLVGVAGDFGKFIGGRFLLPVYTNAVVTDPFRNGTPAAITSLNRAVSAFNYLRASQLLEYVAPTVKGVSATLVYGFGSVAGSSTAGSLANVSLIYHQGPVLVGAAYLFNDYITSSALASGTIPAHSVGTTHVAQIFGHYDFGLLTLSGMYQTYTSAFPGATFTPVKASKASMDNRFWMVGAALPVGRGQFNVSYSHTNNEEVASSNAGMLAAGYTYSLSKSTNLYTGVSHIANGSAADYGVHDASNTFAGSFGQAANGIDLGMRHLF